LRLLLEMIPNNDNFRVSGASTVGFALTDGTGSGPGPGSGIGSGPGSGMGSGLGSGCPSGKLIRYSSIEHLSAHKVPLFCEMRAQLVSQQV